VRFNRYRSGELDLLPRLARPPPGHNWLTRRTLGALVYLKTSRRKQRVVRMILIEVAPFPRGAAQMAAVQVRSRSSVRCRTAPNDRPARTFEARPVDYYRDHSSRWTLRCLLRDLGRR